MRKAFALALTLSFTQPAVVSAQDAVPTINVLETGNPMEVARDRLLPLLNGGGAAEAVFSPEFLAAIPFDQVRQLFAQQITQFGPATAVIITQQPAPTRATMVAQYERGAVTMLVSVDQKSGLIDGLQLTEVKASDTSLSSITKEIQALHGVTAFTVSRLDPSGPVPLASHNADKPMALGSAFKLYVLATLADEVAAKRLRWDQVVEIGPASLPSGITQGWPKGSKVTVDTLATLMISISDNTATDTLIRLIGREKIEQKMAALGHHNLDRAVPFLTTIEAFALKMPGGSDLLTRWNALDSAGRSRMLKADAAAIRAVQMDPTHFSNIPRAIETVEWFASPNDMATLLANLDGAKDPKVREILAINPGTTPARKGALSYLGFKGGSEPGVLTLNWLVRSPSGKLYAIAMSWNDPAAPVDTQTLLALGERVIDNLAQE